MLSGYLSRNKKANRGYYTKIVRILGEYVLASLFCMVCRAVRDGGTVSDMVRSFFLQSFGILSYQSAKYSWYVEMYIGLFLIIPYLNVLYNGLPDKNSKQRLIFTMLLLSGIPEVANCICFSLPWQMTFNDPADFFTVLPNWWGRIYPITCYFLGAYLSEYPLKLSRTKAGALLLSVFLFAGIVNCRLNEGRPFLYAPWQDYGSLFTLVQAVLVFHLLLQLNLRDIWPVWKKILSCLSDLCFSAYLVSSVYDEYFYYMFGMNYGLWRPTLQYFVIVVPIVAFCSLATAFVLVSLYKLLERAFRKCSLARKRDAAVERNPGL